MSRNRTAYWNGNNFTYVDLYVNDIVLMTAYPKSREFHLMASKIMDPHQKQFDRLTRLLDAENYIRALTKLLELTATVVDIDPAELKYLAQSAGIESVNFAKSILSKTVNFFTPPKWLTILCMVILIITLSLIIICCFPNCVQACKMTLQKLFIKRRNNDIQVNDLTVRMIETRNIDSDVNDDKDNDETHKQIHDASEEAVVPLTCIDIHNVTIIEDVLPDPPEIVYEDEQIFFNCIKRIMLKINYITLILCMI